MAIDFVLQAAAAAQDPRVKRAPDPDAELRLLSARADLSDFAGEPLSLDGTVGDLADPGVVVAIPYEAPPCDAARQFALAPPPRDCRTRLLNLVARDRELSAKFDRHLRSANARHNARPNP